MLRFGHEFVLQKQYAQQMALIVCHKRGGVPFSFAHFAPWPVSFLFRGTVYYRRTQSFTPEERKRGARRGGRARAARSRARSTTDDRPRGGADALGQPSVIAIDFMLGKQASTTWLVTAIATW
jgi:hypothetical protein